MRIFIIYFILIINIISCKDTEHRKVFREECKNFEYLFESGEFFVDRAIAFDIKQNKVTGKYLVYSTNKISRYKIIGTKLQNSSQLNIKLYNESNELKLETFWILEKETLIEVDKINFKKTSCDNFDFFVGSDYCFKMVNTEQRWQVALNTSKSPFKGKIKIQAKDKLNKIISYENLNGKKVNKNYFIYKVKSVKESRLVLVLKDSKLLIGRENNRVLIK